MFSFYLTTILVAHVRTVAVVTKLRISPTPLYYEPKEHNTYILGDIIITGNGRIFFPVAQ